MRDPRPITISIVFAVMITMVPVTQTAVDLANEMTPQALDILTLPSFEPAASLGSKTLTLIRHVLDEKHLREYEEALEDNSIFEKKGRQGLQLARYLALGALGEKAVRGSNGWYFYTPDVQYLAEPYFRSPRSLSIGQEDPVAAIHDTAEQLRERGIDLLVVIAPGKPSIYADELNAGLAGDPGVYANTTALRREITALGIPTLDLHEALIAAREAQPDVPLYMKTDTHWTGDGVRIAAEAVADALRARGWIIAPEPAAVRYRRQEMWVWRKGDILEMTKIPGREGLFPEERVRAYQVQEIANNSPYTDDDHAPILWLGDSFSRVFQTDDPGGAGLIANVAFEMQAPLASIVNDGGASALVREQLRRRTDLLTGKRLVIWEFVERDIRFGRNGWPKVALLASPAPEPTQ